MVGPDRIRRAGPAGRTGRARSGKRVLERLRDGHGFGPRRPTRPGGRQLSGERCSRGAERNSKPSPRTPHVVDVCAGTWPDFRRALTIYTLITVSWKSEKVRRQALPLRHRPPSHSLSPIFVGIPARFRAVIDLSRAERRTASARLRPKLRAVSPGQKARCAFAVPAGSTANFPILRPVSPMDDSIHAVITMACIGNSLRDRTGKEFGRSGNAPRPIRESFAWSREPSQRAKPRSRSCAVQSSGSWTLARRSSVSSAGWVPSRMATWMRGERPARCRIRAR